MINEIRNVMLIFKVSYNIMLISRSIFVYQISVEAELMVSSLSAEAVVLSEFERGRMEVGSQARIFSRAVLRTLHH